MITLSDGRLCLMYTQFDGPWDAAPGPLVQRFSSDRGRTWSDAELVRKPEPGHINLMCLSMAYVSPGRIGCVYIDKVSRDAGTALKFMTTDDDAATWSSPVAMTTRTAFYNAPNDRLIRLKTGRLLCSYSVRPAGAPAAPGEAPQANNGCMISDDQGRTWRHSQEIHTLAQHFYTPEQLAGEAVEHRLDGHEPGIVELPDGRVMMHARARHGFIAVSLSSDGGETWSPFTPLQGVASPVSNQNIKQLPGSDRLVMLHNNRDRLPVGHTWYGQRTPLSVAVSDDHGQTWRDIGDIKPHPGTSYCYFSLLFDNGDAFITCYESALVDREDIHHQRCSVSDGSRRNLASLRLFVVDDRIFREGM